MSFQPAFNARLIAEVKKYPCLYNHSKRGSGDTMERMRIWENIAAAVDSNCSGDFAKKRWLQLRDRYRKELKTAIKHNFVTPIRWCYFSHLSWLDPYLKDNLRLRTVYVAYGGIHVTDDQNVGCSGEEEEARIEPSKSEETVAPKETTERKSDRNEGIGSATQVPQSLPAAVVKNHMIARYQQLEQAMIKQAVNAGKSVMDWMNDEDFLYCRIIGVRLKKMDPRKRKRVRAQIMNLLEESEGELDDDDDSMSSPNMDGGESSVFDHSLLEAHGKFDDR
ncbi:unnamed protein product [Heligmosomoides polygyrus]|uniref:MADF domain-containing protein n=1 Tax=Heligmosomoides polygyrus TaxID=6339 RepID=A0A3P7WM55_HELPZ|nr:unnamed protein product [Heligmosomoides polygyrus]